MASPDNETEELACVALLASAYRDATKSVLRHRTNWTLDRIGLSKAKFAKLLHFQRTRISMVLHNSYQSEAVVVYARFAQWLAAQDVRTIYTVARALEAHAPEASGVLAEDIDDATLFQDLREAPSATELADLNVTSRARAYVEALAHKANLSVLERLARSLLEHMKSHPAISAATTLPTLAIVRSYLSGTLALPARSDVDGLVLTWIDSLPTPLGGWLYSMPLGVTGTGREHGVAKPRAVKKSRPMNTDDEDEGSSDSGSDESDAPAPRVPRRSLESKSSTESKKWPRQPNQYPIKTVPGAAAGTPVKKWPRQPNQYAIREPLSEPAKPKQPNQWTVRNVDGTPVSSTPKPIKLHKQHNQYTSVKALAASAATSADVTPVKRKQPNQYSFRNTNGDSMTSSVKRKHLSNQDEAFTLSKRPRSSLSASPAVRSKPYTPRDNGQQMGPHSGYSLDAYTPPVFLRTPMRLILRRVAQVLERDAVSRRQVALQIGISQSKISRLLHGRSPFRTSEEEFHLRHWLYLHERDWVARLSTLVRRSIGRDNVIDFTSLPAPLQSITPPHALITYMHFLTELDKRGAIDTLVAKALGIDSRTWIAEIDAPEDAAQEAADEEAEQAEADAEAAAEDEEMAHEDQDEPPRVKEETPLLSRAERFLARRKQLEDEDEDSSSEQDSDAEATKSSQQQKKPPEAPEELQHRCGLGAWFSSSTEAARVRLVHLSAATSTSQTSLSRFLGASSATVSMLLRGVFRFATLDSHMAKLRDWGHTTDRLLVAKVLSLLGTEHHESTVMDVDDDDETMRRALQLRTVQPLDADSDYGELLGYDSDSDELVDTEADRLRNQPIGCPSAALHELVSLLCTADIPLETAESDDSANGAVAPLSLWSWLDFTCSFNERHRIDPLVVQWAERWSGVESATAGMLTLQHDLVDSCNHFVDYTSNECLDMDEPTPHRTPMPPAAIVVVKLEASETAEKTAAGHEDSTVSMDVGSAADAAADELPALSHT